MKPSLAAFCFLTLTITAARAATPAELKLAGAWEVAVAISEPHALTTNLHVPPAALVSVVGEKYDSLPLYDAKAAGWTKGVQLRGVRAQETTTPGLLDPESLVLRAGPEADAAAYRRGEDYQADMSWGTMGRCTNGTIKEGQPVYASYRHAQLRIDAIVLTGAGQIVLRQGEPKSAAPLPPELGLGERRLANIWLPGRVDKLGPEHLFPVLESAYPEPPKPDPAPAEQLCPKTVGKLRAGQAVRILAWGDSVTACTYVPDWQHNRWQEQFAARLRSRFPDAKVELLTEAWGGRNTGSYLAEPPGSEHNYREKVLAVKPDLIVSEFVNDAGLKPAEVSERYGKLLGDFQAIGTEWIILTPHYVRPDWMGLNRERDIDNDPRPYVAGLRAFAAQRHVALADASLRYGRLWRQGIPYSSLMLNSINHPDPRGMALFADALMSLFP